MGIENYSFQSIENQLNLPTKSCTEIMEIFSIDNPFDILYNVN